MPSQSPARFAPSIRQLGQVLLATLLVAGCPVAAVWWLRASGTVSSPLLGVAVGMTLSIAASYLGCLIWEKRLDAEDLLFSELMLWGYLHRWQSQRRLAFALDMVGPMRQARDRRVDGLSTTEQAKLLEQLVAGLETRDPYLHSHSRRVARHAWMIARQMGLPRAEVARIRTAAAIHDVGKIRTPREILHKPSALSDAEYEIIKAHPGDGAAMADILRDPSLSSMVRHHHERLDGTGYPDRLRGEQIPLGARIIAVADTFDAITSERPYRPASAHKKAIDILREEAGTRLDPNVVRAFCGHYAGRAPIALSSSAAGLPERVLSWLGSSAGSVASAAKVVAVAALVGSAAVTSSTLGSPLAGPRAPGPRARADTSARASGAGAAAFRAPLGSRTVQSTAQRAPGRSLRRHAGVTQIAHRNAVSGSAAATPASGGRAGAAAGGGLANASEETGAGGQGASGSGNAEGAGRGESEIPAKGKAEGPAKSTSEEAHVKSAAAPGKSEEAPGKSEEAGGKGLVGKVLGKVKEVLPKL